MCQENFISLLLHESIRLVKSTTFDMVEMIEPVSLGESKQGNDTTCYTCNSLFIFIVYHGIYRQYSIIFAVDFLSIPKFSNKIAEEKLIYSRHVLTL